MGIPIQDVQYKDSLDDEKPAAPWPQIGSYEENGKTVRVFAPGHAEGSGSDYTIRSSSVRKTVENIIPPVE